MRRRSSASASGGPSVWRAGVACCLASTLLLLSGPALAAGKAGSDVRLDVIREDAEGVHLRILLTEVGLRTERDAAGWRVAELAGLPRVMRPGHPELPVVVLSLAVPDEAVVRLRHEGLSTSRLAGAPPRPVVAIGEDGHLERRPDPAVYEAKAVWPPAPVEMERVQLGGLPVVRLLVYPVRFDPATGDLLVTSTLDVQLDFEGGKGFRLPSVATLDQVGRHLANRKSLVSLAAPAPSRDGQLPKASTNAQGVANPGVKIRVDDEGWIRVDQPALVALGFDAAAVDPRNLQLSNRGTPIPCRVLGEEDGSFDPEDAIEFYGTSRSSRFSTSTVYWLEELATSGMRLPERDATPAGATLAESFPAIAHFEDAGEFYVPDRPAVEGDPHFYWVRFNEDPTPPAVHLFEHQAALDGVVPGGEARLTALFSGRSDGFFSPDHLVEFAVNGNVIGDSGWDGPRFHTAELTFDGALLEDVSNAFTFERKSFTAGDDFYMDWFEIEYPRATVVVDDVLAIRRPDDPAVRYQVAGVVGVDDPLVIDVTHELAPVRLTGTQLEGAGPYSVSFEDRTPGERRYLVVGDGGRQAPDGLELDVPSDLQAPDGGADMIVIVPDGWEETLEPLVQHRRDQGLRVVMANLTDVADEFGGGNVDDVTIRDFIRHAYENWAPPQLSKALLIGEPNLDPRNQLDKTAHDHLMPTHFGVTSVMGEMMSDNWFGDVTGGDLIPEVAMGRISADEVTEMAGIVTKLINYDTFLTGSEAWVRRALHVAANEVEFEHSLETSAQYLPSNYTLYQEYRRAGADADSIHSRLVNGVSIASFVGHGNVDFWADNPGGPFFRTSNVNAVTNSGRLPFVTALNCLNGLVGDPIRTNSMAEAFMNRPHPRGALAVFTTAALGFLTEYDALQEILYRRLFAEYQTELGALTREALVETWLTRPVGIGLLKKMILVGDPSSRILINCPTGTTDLSCNGVDDDCNGTIDDGWVSEATTCGSGECQQTGQTECIDGELIDTCVVPTTDVTCDGVDDDCDGSVDEEWTSVETSCGLGLCASTGLTSCDGGVLIDSCVAGIPGDELCDTQLDEDCDGAVDESDAIDATDWFPDVDGDGFGNDQSVLRSCTSPLGHVADGPDCDDLDPLVWSTPDEVPGLRFIDGERLGWSLPEESGGVAPVTEILRASSGTGFDDVSKVCVEVQSRITVVLPDVPPTGQAWYYLVRMTTTCPDGVGPLGTDSAGAARTASACVD